MASTPSPATTSKGRFCSDCGMQLNAGGRFCHGCGAAVGSGTGGASRASGATSSGGLGNTLRWAVPTTAFVIMVIITAVQFARRDATEQPATAGMPLGAPGGAAAAPDISSMSPEERADRLFNRVMRLSTEGKNDSAAFFGPMALGALQALTPLDAHRRYDIGLVALVSGENDLAAAHADTILAERRQHLLGLSLAARAAEARGDRTKAADFRRRMIAAEATEKAAGLQEYKDHEPDVTAAISAAREGRSP